MSETQLSISTLIRLKLSKLCSHLKLKNGKNIECLNWIECNLLTVLQRSENVEVDVKTSSVIKCDTASLCTNIQR